MDIQIPSLSEYEQINTLAKQVHDLHVGWRPDIYNKTDFPLPREYFAGLIENSNIAVAKIDGDIVGYIVFSDKKNNPDIMVNEKAIVCEALAVDEKHRRQGIGKALISHMIDMAKRRGCTLLQLSVNEENKNAIKMYEDLGMRVKGISYSMKI